MDILQFMLTVLAVVIGHGITAIIILFINNHLTKKALKDLDFENEIRSVFKNKYPDADIEILDMSKKDGKLH